jgi:hypothetical protein
MGGAMVFINYRRADAGGYAGRLYDSLAAEFGRERVFMDVDNIPPGVDFPTFIYDAVGRCKALLALIGPTWLTVQTSASGRRIDAPGDHVRLEIEAALQRGIFVLPVLLPGAVMPGPDDLPPSLRPLSRRNAIELSDSRWRYDVSRVVDALREATGEPSPPPLAPVQTGRVGVAAQDRRRGGVPGRAIAAVMAAGLLVSVGILAAALRPSGTPAATPNSAVSVTPSGGGATATAAASLATAAASTGPTPSSSAFPTADEQALLDHIPTTIAPHCERAGSMTGGLGGLVSVRCRPPDGGADIVWYDEFSTHATAAERFQRLVTASGVQDGTCTTTVTEAVGDWLLGSGVAGDLLCYSADGAAWIVWTYTDEPIVAQATRADGNGAALYTWWKGVGPYLR